MQKTQISVFNRENVREILANLDFKMARKKVSEKKYRDFVVDKDKEPVLCHSCKRKLPVRKVGNIAYGSKLLFCDNPVCFATWVAKNKI